MNLQQYSDRIQAGIVLATHLKKYDHAANTIVLGLPRGGVPVAYEVAHKLSLPLDVFIVRKLGVPGHEELAMGALASGNTLFFNEQILKLLQISKEAINNVIANEQIELERREQAYRRGRPFPDLKGKTIILVDDGIATGATMNAAIDSLRKQQPEKIIVAVPVASLSTCKELKQRVYELICPIKPIDFHAVGLWYQDFSQTSDQEVTDLLDLAQNNVRSGPLSSRG